MLALNHQHRGEENIWLQVFFLVATVMMLSLSKSNIKSDVQAVLLSFTHVPKVILQKPAPQILEER